MNMSDAQNLMPLYHASPDPRVAPYFPLKATDRCAPAALLRWVELAAGVGAPPEKLRGAMEIYLAMIQWQRDNPSLVHTPD